MAAFGKLYELGAQVWSEDIEKSLHTPAADREDGQGVTIVSASPYPDIKNVEVKDLRQIAVSERGLLRQIAVSAAGH